MRVAVLILGLFCSIFSGLQSCAVHVGGRIVADNANVEAGAVGVAISVLFLLGAALAIGFPRGSQICFIISFGLAMLNREAFPDMTFWAGASFILNLMAYYGHRELKKTRAAAAVSIPANRE